MQNIPLHHVWHYNEVDRAFWEEHLAPWLPDRIIDGHVHVSDPALNRVPVTEAMRRQYWVNEVFVPMDAPTAERCYQTVLGGRMESCVAFGVPDLSFDLEQGNRYAFEENSKRGWHSLALVNPKWTAEQVDRVLNQPSVIGLKPYYALIGYTPDTRDAYLEASIFDFLPHAHLEVAHQHKAWITLHVPKAARLGHPDNLREVREIRKRYPGIRLVIAHLGRCYTEQHAKEALPPLAEDPGLYFDTSAVLNPASHRVALECIGCQRLIYGSDNPIMFMRGRRQYRGSSYINRTSYPFYFNKEREPADIEASYTLYMYEDMKAIKQACQELGITCRTDIQALFHDNAARLIADIISAKSHNKR